MTTLSIPRKFIVVEGKTDMHVVLHLLNKKNPQMDEVSRTDLSITVQLEGVKSLQLVVSQAEGFDNVCNEIRAKIMEPKLECIGFVFDANGAPDERWQKIRNKIHKAHPKLQSISSSTLNKIFHEMPVQGGVWIKDYRPEVGIWMMPNNKDTGAIEDFLAYMIREEDHCWESAKDYVKTVFQKGMVFPDRRVLKEKDISKARIYAWLAVQEKPGSPPGAAIGIEYFDTEGPKVQAFQEWLGNLP